MVCGHIVEGVTCNCSYRRSVHQHICYMVVWIRCCYEGLVCSVIHTDGWEGYAGLEDIGYRHKEKILRGNRKKAHELMPRVHQVASLLKRWILGTHQGAVSNAHLDYYLDEFVFRFNRRISQYRGKLFYRLLQQAVRTAPAPYAVLNKRIRSGSRGRRPGHG